MSRLPAALFWTSIGTLAYTFVVFPLLVVIRGLSRGRPPRAADAQPGVSVLIAAYNEEAAIAAKVENLLSLDYPHDRLEIVVASDGSDDRTTAIVARYTGRGVRLLQLPRSGKAAALQAAAEASSADFLVFTDANSMLAGDALTKLTAPYGDPLVGGVAGNQVYRSPTSSQATEAGERSYWSFDRVLKTFEGKAGSTISATGALYTIRRELFKPIPPGVNDDFYLSLGVIQQGYRLAFAADAVAFEPPGTSLRSEYSRKVRVMTRGMRCAWIMRSLLNPRQYGFYSIQFFSHKILRWGMFIPVAVLMATSLRLAQVSAIYRVAAFTQILGYGLALAGLVLAETPLGRKRVMTVPAYFLLANAAAAQAGINLVRGRQIDRWVTHRGKDANVTISDGSRAGP